MMTKVNWEVKDIMCEHSKYVDYFLQVSYFIIKEFFTTYMILINYSIEKNVDNCKCKLFYFRNYDHFLKL